MNSELECAYLDGPGGVRLAYRLRPGRRPTLLFLPGYASDMDGSKAVALDQFAAKRDLGMLRFDYSGTGLSGGRFEDGTLEGWLGDSMAMIDERTEGPLILVGSSMGGWLALHLALRRAERVQALVGIAAAPDFTNWGFTDPQKEELKDNGILRRGDVAQGTSQLTTLGFWRSGEDLRLLDGPIAIDCPVRLVHGDADPDVPLEIAFRTVERLRSVDVQLIVVKDGGHRLSEPHEIDAILATVSALLEPSR